MIGILNPWTSTATKKNFFSVADSDLIYRNGDYSIFEQWKGAYLYTFKKVAFNCLAGVNKPHLDRVATRQAPTGDYSPDHFLYERAVCTLNEWNK